MSELGKEIHRFIRVLYPICRSITGDGVRATLRSIQQLISLEIHEVPSGTEVFDWTVPLEWNISDAYIKNRKGERIVDFNKCNLHVVNYSIPVHTTMRLEELKAHLFTLPAHPVWIPYRTSYYEENWGFCLSYKQFSQLANEEYEVCIDSRLTQGALTYGEYYLQGSTADEVLVSCHICHPSLCNDNLSGIAVSTFLANELARRDRRYSYRFLFVPGTIGSITWLAQNEALTHRIKHGLVLSGVGDAGRVTYKKSRRGNAEIDRAMAHVLKHSGSEHDIIDFFPYGYDERQYCSPGFNLPVGCFMRTPHGQYPEYHTSADDLDFVKPASLAESFSHCLSALTIIDNNKTFVNQSPHCEPQLGKRGLYRAIGGQSEEKVNELALLWVLNLSDGRHSLLDITDRAVLPFDVIYRAAEALSIHRLLKEAV